jgi:zinc transport system ATP-binding protein
MEKPVIEIKDLWFSRKGQVILRQVHMDVLSGDFVALIGPNGGGKTTLLKLILGLLKPTKGSVRVLGTSPEASSHHVGYVPQNVHINGDFPITAMDVVLMGKLEPGSNWRGHSVSDRSDALKALEQMGMGPYAHSRIGSLSGGQRQRVLIARALVTRPKVLLLDEPTASIDTKGQSDFYQHLKELNKDVTILVVSHDLLVVSKYIKSVACVNICVHYHKEAEITEGMLEAMYPCAAGEPCPVELIAHGLPHRVLQHHKD